MSSNWQCQDPFHIWQTLEPLLLNTMLYILCHRQYNIIGNRQYNNSSIMANCRYSILWGFRWETELHIYTNCQMAVFSSGAMIREDTTVIHKPKTVPSFLFLLIVPQFPSHSGFKSWSQLRIAIFIISYIQSFSLP